MVVEGKQMKEKNVKKNTLYSIIKSCSSIIFPLITFPYISRVLLAENLGKVNFGNSIVSYFALIASLGITTYAVRECSKVRDNKHKLERLSSEILTLNIGTTIFAYICLGIILIGVHRLKEYKLLIIIQSMAIIFTTFGADWLNTAMEDFKYITIRTFVFQLISLILMFIFVRTQNDYLKYAVITVVASSGGNIVNILYRKKYCKTKIVLHVNLRKHFPPIIRLFAMTLAQQIFVNSDTTMLGFFRGDYEVGLYSTSVKIYTIINTVLASIAWVVMPQMAEGYAKKDYIKLNNLIKYVIGFTATLGIPCVIGIMVLAPQLIEMIAGVEYIEAAGSLRILSISLLFSLCWGIVMNIILLPEGKDKVCLRACIISAILNMILNVCFIPQYGFIAASVTTALSQLIGIIFCVPYIDNQIKFRNKKKILIPTIVGGGVISYFLVIIKKIVESTLGTTFAIIIGSAILYFLIQIIMKNEWLEEILSSLMGKFRK